MIISEVELYNFRLYKGVTKIKFTPSENHNISIICGNNGFGKTTFLVSLVWCLYGEGMKDVDEQFRKEVDQNGTYIQYMNKNLNKAAQQNESKHKFWVMITFKDVNIPSFPEANEIKVKRTYSILNRNDEELNILINGKEFDLSSDDKQEKQDFIESFILPKHIAKFFFFDAEKIVQWATSISGSEYIKNLSAAYNSVLGISKYKELKESLDQLINSIRKEMATKVERDRLSDIEQKLSSILKEEQDIDSEIMSLNDSLQESKYKLEKIQEKLIRAGNIITTEELNELRNKKHNLEAQKESLLEKVKSSYEDIPFAICGKLLLLIQEQVSQEFASKQSEYNYSINKEKIETILNNVESFPRPDDLVIDWKVKSYFMDTFRKVINNVLLSDSEEIEADVKIIQNFSNVDYEQLKKLIQSLKTGFKDNFKSNLESYHHTKNKLNAVSIKLREAEGQEEDDSTRKLRESKKLEADKIDTIVGSREIKRKELEDLKNQKIKLTKEKENLLKKIELSNQNESKIMLIERLKKAITRFLRKFKEYKKDSLEESIVKWLNTILHKKDFIGKVYVDITEGGMIEIELYDKKNNLLKLSELSMGERQLYVTALLQALIEQSSINFPIFIDSPMQKLDKEHAQNIIKNFYPNISKQVVILPLLGKEMTLREFELLKQSLDKCYIIKNESTYESRFEEVSSDALFENV